MAEFEVPKSMAQKPWAAAPGVEGREDAGMGSGQGRSHTAGGAIVGARSRALGQFIGRHLGQPAPHLPAQPVAHGAPSCVAVLNVCELDVCE